MRRTAAAACGVVALGLGAALLVPAPAAVGGPPPDVLRAGDVVRVEGLELLCTVVRRESRRALECVRKGRRRGTYGVRVGASTVAVFRFESEREAETVLAAKDGNRRFTVCRSGR